MKKQPVFGRLMSTDIWLTGIIGRASAVRIVTGSGCLRSILQTLCTLSSKFGVFPLLNSGAIALSPKLISKIGQLHVLLDSVPCLHCKATVGEISAAMESSATLTVARQPFLVVAASSTKGCC